MKLRKILLLAGCAIMLCVCILQSILLSKDTTKTLTIETQPDEIQISTANGSFTLTKKADGWVGGNENYPINSALVDSMLSDFSEIKILDTVGNSANATILERYHLTPENSINVVATAQGNQIGTLTIGKVSSTGGQTYITLNNGKDILLVSGNLVSTFDKSLEDLRDKTVWNINKDSIYMISSETDSESWQVARDLNQAESTWSITPATLQVDSAKITDWANSLASLSTIKWLSTESVLQGKKEASIAISTPQKTVTLELFHVASQAETQADMYYATSSETPYPFEVATYVAQKFIKNPNDFVATGN